ncbi:transporter [Seiridium cupressi]
MADRKLEEDDRSRLEGHGSGVPHIGAGYDSTTSMVNVAASETATWEKNDHIPVTESNSDLESRRVFAHEDSSMTDDKIVWWDGPNDPENPYNWPNWRKFLNCGLISIMTLVSALGSSIFAPSVPQVMAEFESTSLTMASFVVSVYILGYASGPFLLAPLSEIYGRVIVYHVCDFCFVLLSVGSALAPSLSSLIAIRFFAGVAGCAPVTNGGGSIADMVLPEHRGIAMALYSVAPLAGPIIGPIVGGFVSQALGWRWTFWVLSITAGVVSLAMLCVLKESYAYVILKRKTARLQKETGDSMLKSKLDSGLSPIDHFKRGIIRPIRMFIMSPVISITSLYMALSYGYLYLMFTTMTTVFEDTYGFSTGLVGLAYLGLGVGSMIGVVYTSLTSDRHMKKKPAETGGTSGESKQDQSLTKPEHRLKNLPLGAILVPCGFFIYGWTAQYRVHWIVPMIAHIPIGLGIQLIFFSIQVYLIDAFTIYAASAIASNTVVRSMFGAFLPMAGLPMFSGLGLGWGNSCLGFIALIMIPFAFILIRWGEYLRNRYAIKDV